MGAQGFNVAEKNAGYASAAGAFTPGLAAALLATDAYIGEFVSKLKTEGKLNNTYIIVTAKHGQSPIDESLVGASTPWQPFARTGCGSQRT